MTYIGLLPSILRKKACDGKAAYATRGEARHALRLLAQYVCDGHKGTMNVYRCQFCDKFHFGHKPKSRYEEIPT